MNYLNFLILQFIAHVLADFIFQTDKSVKEKNQNGFISLTSFKHLIIVFLLSWAFSIQWNFIFAALVIALLHYIVDGIKSVLVQKEKFQRSLFFFDQILHLFIIYIVITIFAKYYFFNSIFQFSIDTKTLLIFTAYLFCLKPTNIVIKEIFKAYKIVIPKDGTDEIPNAGKLIGNVERILTLTLILINQYEAVGFIIAAKSILRFKDTDNKAEYVLVGTLLSFGIAVIAGILVQFYK